MKTLYYATAIILFLAFSPMVSQSQEINISGIVVNSNQDPVSNVLVSLKSNPDYHCSTNKAGEFSLKKQQTGIQHFVHENEYVKQLSDGSIELSLENKSMHYSLIDIRGRSLTTVTWNGLHGVYQIFPQAYLSGFPEGIYIARIVIENRLYSFKCTNINANWYSQGMTRIADLPPTTTHVTKSDVTAGDSLIFSHDFYRITKVFISEMEIDLGIIELENFDNYTISKDMDPDKTILKYNQGNFLEVSGENTTTFRLKFDAFSVADEEIPLVAIPVEEFDFLGTSMQLISGIHLEPAGLQFVLPVEVCIDLHDISPSDSLVVFHYDREKDKICYLPYLIGSIGLDAVLIFYISHFSDYAMAILYGDGSISSDIPDELPESFANSDDAMSYIANRMKMGQEVSDATFDLWYNSVVKGKIAGISDFESLYDAISNFAMMAKCTIYAGKFITDFTFYEEASKNLSEKAGYIMDMINEECGEHSDVCLIRVVTRLGIQLVNLTQLTPWIDNLSITDICNNIMPGLVDMIEIENGLISMGVNETAQIPFKLLNLDKEEVTAEVSWRSEDPGIVTVNENGGLLALKKGKTKVFVKHCELESYVIVYVEDEQTSFCDKDPAPDSGKYTARFLVTGYYNPTAFSRTTTRLSITLNIDMAHHGFTATSHSSSISFSWDWFWDKWGKTVSFETTKMNLFEIQYAFCNNKGYVYDYFKHYGAEFIVSPQSGSARVFNIVWYGLPTLGAAGTLQKVSEF